MLKEKVMVDYTEGTTMSELSMRNLNVALGEFVTHYRAAGGVRVQPSTMVTYIHGLGRFFKSQQQAQGAHRRPWNTLLDKEVETILDHEVTNRRTPSGYSSYCMVVAGLLLGLRTTSCRFLKWNNFEITTDDQGKKAYRYTGKAGSTEGDSKTEHGGIAHVQEIPTTFLIYDDELAYGM
eukprot:IDg18450t1